MGGYGGGKGPPKGSRKPQTFGCFPVTYCYILQRPPYLGVCYTCNIPPLAPWRPLVRKVHGSNPGVPSSGLQGARGGMLRLPTSTRGLGEFTGAVVSLLGPLTHHHQSKLTSAPVNSPRRGSHYSRGNTSKAGNRTRADSVAGSHSTTRPLTPEAHRSTGLPTPEARWEVTEPL